MSTKNVVGKFGEFRLGATLATLGACINVRIKLNPKASPFESVDSNVRVEVRGKMPADTNVGMSHVITVVDDECSNVFRSTTFSSNRIDTPLREVIFLSS